MADKNQSEPATSQPTKDVPTLVSSNPGASPAVPSKGSNPGRGKGEGEGEFSGSRGARGGRGGREGRDGRGRGRGRGGDDRINQIPEKDRTRVYLGHLPLDIEEAEIISLCTPYGPVTSVTSVKKKGIAFVTFKTHDAAQMALYDLGFKKRKYRDDFIEIDWAKPEAKKGGENEENADANEDVNTKGAKGGDKTNDKDATEKKEEPKRPLFSEMQKAKVAPKKPPTPQTQKKTNTPNANATGIQVAKPTEAPAPVASAPKETKPAKKDNKAAEPNKAAKNNNNNNKKQQAQATGQAQAPAQEKPANNNNKKAASPVTQPAQTQQNKQQQPQKKQQQNNKQSSTSPAAKYEVKVREIASGENKITLNSVSADAVEKFVKPLKSVKFEVIYKNEATGEENTARMTESEFQQYFLPLVQSHNSALGL